MTYVGVVLRERGIDALMAVVDVITITIDGMTVAGPQPRVQRIEY